MIEFWAKTTPEGKPGISVYDHMVNVGSVARCIADASPKILERFNLQAPVVGALAALHDLGKISPGFQQKCVDWLRENDLLKIALNGCWDTVMERDHGKVSHYAIQAFLLEKGIDGDAAKYGSCVLGAHHGRLNPVNDRGYRPPGLLSDAASRIDWDCERINNARAIWEYFIQDHANIILSEDSPALWWLAGLATVSDWVGSDERFFFPGPKIKDAENSFLIARKALVTIGLDKTSFIKGRSFHDLFHDLKTPEIKWTPNDMQLKAVSIVNGPGVYIIEAPMGMGKTEAALWAAYNLLVSGKAAGIYFALPTQATSNRIHLRVNEFLRRICTEAAVSRLVHANSWLTDANMGILPAKTDKQEKRIDDARIGQNWFASAKRALIAPFGVGTVDQALLGVVAAKHFFVRHFALAGKVVVIDEVHSYDLYTGTLIDKLISTLEGLGCTVIILSATLTKKRRSQIVLSPEGTAKKAELSCPLITGRGEDKAVVSAMATAPESHNVKVDFIDTERATGEAVELAGRGGAVLWICDTIDSAQKQYRRIKDLSLGKFQVGLLHSRFPFLRRGTLEDEWMKRFDKSGATRCGAILVSTQIVEQSVDLDADLLITELAPTDMLLQRLGRLWRHERQQRPVKKPRVCIIKEDKSLQELRSMEPKAIIEAFGGKAHVYDPFVLLRTLQLWKKYPRVLIPAQIRELIEATYCDRDDDPKSWQKLFDDRFIRNSNERFKATMNGNYWQPQLADEEGVQTRLNDMPTVSVVLCRSIDRQKVEFIDGISAVIGGEDFVLDTARAINKNLVKVPCHCFEKIIPCPAFIGYLYGNQTLGIVGANGVVEVKGLNIGTRLFYSDEIGLTIEKSVV